VVVGPSASAPIGRSFAHLSEHLLTFRFSVRRSSSRNSPDLAGLEQLAHREPPSSSCSANVLCTSHKSCRRPHFGLFCEASRCPKGRLAPSLSTRVLRYVAHKTITQPFRSLLNLILTPRGSPHCLSRSALSFAQHSLCGSVDVRFSLAVAGHSSACSPSIRTDNLGCGHYSISRPPPHSEHVSFTAFGSRVAFQPLSYSTTRKHLISCSNASRLTRVRC
jgi:hypothetical protein